MSGLVDASHEEQTSAESDVKSRRALESRSINSTRVRRLLVRATTSVCHRLGRQHGGITFVINKICIKQGSLRHLAEASAMQFIAHNTSVPVPKVYCAFERMGCTYIVMEKIAGDMLAQGCVAQRSEESKTRILLQLKRMIDEIRELPRPDDKIAVSNVDGGPIWDCRMPNSILHGPFDDTEAFHQYLRNGHAKAPSGWPELEELVQLHARPWSKPVFTHGDLSSLNILVRGDDVVGIIDWETSGWYPPYWEYTTACNVNPRNYFWSDEIDKFLEPMPTELHMEQIREKYYGDIPDIR